LSTVQDLFVTPLWMVLVWAVHAVVVMLEWCFTIDLLDSAAAGGVGRGLREMQAMLTMPWLAVVLPIASILAVYNGLLRRRVADTVGQTLIMATMIAGGMWLITDPAGTVGALGKWANQASLGTLAVAARGTPDGAGGVLARSMGTLFTAAIEAPWCYLEFGDVAWCRDPGRLDPRLRAAALRIAAGELALTGCAARSGSPAPCSKTASSQSRALEHSAELLREARSNGAIFLALPANGPARNSINEPRSLLRTMCQSAEATNCRGTMAAQAGFRTNGGTWPRVGGLLLITAGVLGMMLLLGFIAMRLLAAAIFSLLYLLLAPAMVLAPALGEGGRALFRRWLTLLLGAIVSKLTFSFLLGVLLAVLAILSGLSTLGWWTQWLLMSAFWWGAYLRRHQVIGAVGSAHGREQEGTPRSLAHRVRTALDSPRSGLAVAQSAKRRADARLASLALRSQQRERVSLAGRAGLASHSERLGLLRRVGSKGAGDEQVKRVLELELREAHARLRAAPATRADLAKKHSRLERLRRERRLAVANGSGRRAIELQHRAARIAGQIEREQLQLTLAQRTVAGRRNAMLRTDRTGRRERGRFLDYQATLPRAAHARGSSGERRDYPALAAIAGYGRDEYRRLTPARQRAARVEIDRQLASRNELTSSTRGVVNVADASRRAGGHPAASSGTAPELARDGGAREPGVVAAARSRGTSARAGRPESAVMRDAREVAAGRKRQLGSDRS
jgi:hypothetical protein